MTERIRVALVDDYVLVRKGMAVLLAAASDIEIVGEAADGDEVAELVERCSPSVVLMDIRMPRVDGIEATRRLRESHPDVAVVVLTAHADDRRVADAIDAGAAGALIKDISEDDLHRAVRAAHAGEAVEAPPSSSV